MSDTQIAVTAAQMREIDRVAMEEYGIPAGTLMENAGRMIAEQILKSVAVFSGTGCVIACGKGNNGGDGLVCARYLKQAGVGVEIHILGSQKYNPLVELNITRAREAGIPLREFASGMEDFRNAVQDCSVAVDALLGTGAQGGPQGLVAEAVCVLNSSDAFVVSADIPSGLDADTGEPSVPCVRARLTCSIGLAKKGFFFPGAKDFVGRLRVLDIGFPEEAVRKVTGV